MEQKVSTMSAHCNNLGGFRTPDIHSAPQNNYHWSWGSEVLVAVTLGAIPGGPHVQTG